MTDLDIFRQDEEAAVWNLLESEERAEPETPYGCQVAKWFLSQRKSDGNYEILNYDQLVRIAQRSDRLDIPAQSGTYVFLQLTNLDTLKVGQSQNIRQRVLGHLGPATGEKRSLITNWVRDSGTTMDRFLLEQQVFLVLFHMPCSNKLDREIVETALQVWLSPELP